MDRLVNEEYLRLLYEVPDNNVEIDNIIDILSKYVPDILIKRGIGVLKMMATEPSNDKSNRQNNNEFVLLETQGEQYSYKKELTFNMANDGVTTVCALADKAWTEEMDETLFVIAKTVFVLYGRTRAMKELTILTFTDAKTGVLNETGLYRYVGKKLAMGENASYCLSFINLKNMKLINDSYGLPCGDMILRKFAKNLEQLLGEDGCVARLGGDNFVAFTDKKRQEELLSFINNQTIDIMSPKGDTIGVNVNARVGYYYLKEKSSIGEAMANSSMAFAKTRQNSSPDVIMYEEYMKMQVLEQKLLEQSIPDAVVNEEFVVFYQPKVSIEDADNFTLCGAEALMRWKKGDEIIPPGKFIPILEKNGMITIIDFYVLEHVCQDIKEWERQGIKPVRISLNLSRRHLRNEQFAQKVEAIIRKYDVNPDYLEVEITETYDIEDLEAIKRFEMDMHRLGLCISIDDFGSGFSSIKMVKDTSADIVKLDKSLIDGIGAGDAADELIVGHIISMIKELNKDVIAEGVEYKEQADYLRANGCMNIQGFLYARPMPKEEFELKLKKM